MVPYPFGSGSQLHVKQSLCNPMSKQGQQWRTPQPCPAALLLGAEHRLIAWSLSDHCWNSDSCPCGAETAARILVAYMSCHYHRNQRTTTLLCKAVGGRFTIISFLITQINLVSQPSSNPQTCLIMRSSIVEMNSQGQVYPFPSLNKPLYLPVLPMVDIRLFPIWGTLLMKINPSFLSH